MKPGSSESKAEDEKPSRRPTSGIPPRWVLLAGISLSALAAWSSPEAQTFVFLSAALLLLVVILGLGKLGSRTRLLSVRVRPELVLSGVTIFVVLVFFELGLRLFAFQSFPDFNRMTRITLDYVYDPLLGWCPKPSSEKTVAAGDRWITITNNSKGLRDIEPACDALPGARDPRPGIIFLGDSFVWGYDLEARERFTDKLRARHPEWRIYNLGVVGYGTDQEYLLLQRHFQECNPQLVVLIFCPNDHSDNAGNGRSDWAFKPYYTVEGDELRLRGVPVPHSDLLFCKEHPWLSRPYLSRLSLRAWGNLVSPPPRSREDPTTKLLGAIEHYASRGGAGFCVGLIARDEPVERFLQNSKIPFADLSTDLLLKGDWHWSAEGNTSVADKLDAFLGSGKFLEGGVSPGRQK
jgi:hypothetical protein